MVKIPESLQWETTGEELGSGGQSRVLVVKPKGNSQFPDPTYAMKILKNVGGTQAQARFRQEISAVQQLSDPRIAHVLDFSEPGAKFQYYVMPHFPAEFQPLDKILFAEESPFLKNPLRCLDFLAECADVLGRVHDAKIVHRDIKPANILCHRTTFKPVILDFGCCQIDDGQTITLTDEGVGTRNYMAPECEAGCGLFPSSKSDIYSLGKLLWTMVTGQQPFARESPAFTSKNLAQVLPNDPDCWHLTRIFEKTIRKDPNNRYQDARAMFLDLRRISKTTLGRILPLELIGELCPMCGSGVTSRVYGGKYELQLWQVFQNPLPNGVTALQCTTCGNLWVWDFRPLRDRKQELAKMD